MDSPREGDSTPSRWQRRDKRRAAERARIKKHGAALGRVYRDAVLKRVEARKGR